jgi:hypothetical protein
MARRKTILMENMSSIARMARPRRRLPTSRPSSTTTFARRMPTSPRMFRPTAVTSFSSCSTSAGRPRNVPGSTRADTRYRKEQFGGVEPYWGLFNEDKTLKQGLTIPDCLVESPTVRLRRVIVLPD